MRQPGQFVREMRRRRVFRTAGFYVVGAWVLVQVIALAFQSFGIPDAALQYVWLAGIAGFPLALILGWQYDITPQGIVRTPPADTTEAKDLSLRKTDYIGPRCAHGCRRNRCRQHDQRDPAGTVAGCRTLVCSNPAGNGNSCAAARKSFRRLQPGIPVGRPARCTDNDVVANYALQGHLAFFIAAR